MSTCINPNSEDFKNALKTEPNILLAEVAVDEALKNYDSFSPESEADYLKDDTVVKTTANSNSLLYGETSNWEHKTVDKMPVLSDSVLKTLMNNPKYKITDSVEAARMNELIEAVGEKEAYRDYFENNMSVRPSAPVVEKIIERLEQESFEEEQDLLSEVEPEEVSDEIVFKEILDAHNNLLAIGAMEKLSTQLGVPYEIISVEDAQKIVNNLGNAKGFYKAGKVYFVESRFDADTVFHEFAHPILKSIAQQNPALFKSLYEELLSTPEGMQIVNDITQNESTLVPDSVNFMEEAMVRFLETENTHTTPQSKSFLKELLFNIKQFLRKVFGKKIDVSKLNVNTRLSDLLKMINQGEEFVLDTDFLSMDDYVMFKKVYEAEVDQLKTATLQETQKVMSEFYSLVKRQLTNFQASEGIFAKIQEDLADENNTGLLQKMQKALEELAVYGSRKTVTGLQFADITLDRDIEIIDNKLRSFVQVVHMADLVFKKFENKLKNLEQTGVKTDDQFDQLFAIMQYIEDWKLYLEKAQNNYIPFNSEVLNEQNQYVESPMAKLVSNAQRSLRAADAIAEKLKVDSVVDSIYTHLKNIMDPIVQSHLEQMDKFKKANMLNSYDKWHKELYGLTVTERAELNILDSKLDETLTLAERERKLKLTLDSYDAYIITKDSVRAMASNRLGDASKWNGMMESYLANQDKVVGSFYEMLTRTFNGIDANVNSKRESLLSQLKSKLQAADQISYVLGEGALGKDIGQISNVGKTNNGVVADYQEYQFMSNYINYEFAIEELTNTLSRANKEFNQNPSDANKEAVDNAKKDLEKFNNDYMHRDYVDSYYELDKFFDSPAGEEAKKRRTEIFEKMRIVTDNIVYDPTNFVLSSEMKTLWSDYQRLFSDFDVNGKKKTGIDLEIATLLKEWREASVDYYEWNEIDGLFEDSLNNMVNILISQNITPGTPAFEEEIKKWLEHNTQVEVKEDYFEKRKELIDERSALLEPLISQNLNIKDIGPLYDEIYELLKVTKDSSNQFDGTSISDKVASRIVSLHEQIEEAKQLFLQLNGRSKEDNRKFSIIKDYLETFDQFPTQEDEDFYYDYIDGIDFAMAELGISDDDIQRVKEIDEQLGIISQSSATNYYMDQFQNLVNANADTKKKFDEYFESRFLLDLAVDSIEEHHINEMLEDSEFIINELLEDDAVLAEWFYNNHYNASVNKFNKADGTFIGEMDVFKKTAAWQFSSPRNLSFYNTKSTTSFNPVLQSVLPNGYLELNGIPRIPSKTYFTRDVKEEFQTEVIPRDYIDGAGNLVLANQDNRGRWLPREDAVDKKFINANYRQLFNTDREKFDLLMYLKNTALDWEEGLDNSQKMYLTYAKFRKGTVEQYDKGYFKRKANRVIESFGYAEDDAELGMFTGAGLRNPDNTTFTRPIAGNYNLDINDVSTNVVRSMLDRMYSIEHFKAMRKVNSYANVVEKALIHMSKHPQLLEIEKNLRDSELVTGTNEPEQLERIKAIRNIIDRHFKGITLKVKNDLKRNTGELTAVKLISQSQRWISFKSFALDPVKSLTNYFGGKSAMWKKAIEGNAYGLKDLTYTRGKSLNAIKLIIKNMYSKEQTPLELQLIDIMGAIPGRLRSAIGETATRTVGQSVLNGAFFYFDRRILSESVPVHQFYAILHKNSFMLDGKMTPLYDAIEMVDGKIQTKAGAPKEFSITYDNNGDVTLGSKLLEIRNVHEAFLNKNMGISTQWTDAEMYRSIWGKTMGFLKKFYWGMFYDRFQMRGAKGKRGEKRLNFATKQSEIGTYIAAISLLKEIYDSNGNITKFGTYSNQSKKGALQLIAGLSFSYLFKLIGSALWFQDDEDDPTDFNYDPDAKNIYKRLADATPPPPMLPFLNDKHNPYRYGPRWNTENWLKMTALRLIYRANKEETTFFSPQSFLQSIGGNHPLSEGGVVGEVVSLAELIYNDDVYEKEAGVFVWQEKQDGKFWNTVFKGVGITGDIINPSAPFKRENSGYLK